MSKRKKVSLRDVQSLVGSLTFSSRVISPGMCFCRRLYNLTIGKSNPNDLIRLNREASEVTKGAHNISMSQCRITKSKLKLNFVSYKYSSGRPFKLDIPPTGGSTCPHRLLRAVVMVLYSCFRISFLCLGHMLRKCYGKPPWWSS